MYDVEMKVGEVLKRAIKESGVSRYRIAQETGIEQSALSRFMSGERGLALDAVEALCSYFKLELRPAERDGKGR